MPTDSEAQFFYFSFFSPIFACNLKTEQMMDMDLITFFKKDKFAAMAGVELVDVKPGYAKAQMAITPAHLNAGGVCQGGALFTLADLAFAAAVNSHGALTFSTHADIVFLRSVSEGTLTAEATEVYDHHRLPFGEVKITDEQGALVAVLSSSGYRKGK